VPVLFIPALLRELTGGQKSVCVPGKTVGEALDALEVLYPGVKERLMDGDKLRPDISVAVDSVVSRQRLRQRLEESSEVHFLPAISGG
jgi:molybdopterin synthase sulfur carrier subunit